MLTQNYHMRLLKMSCNVLRREESRRKNIRHVSGLINIYWRDKLDLKVQ